jgi:hypothetical protein
MIEDSVIAILEFWKMVKSIFKNIFLWFLILSVPVTWWMIFRTDAIHDFGYMLDICWRMANGQKPYTDFSLVRTPLSFYVPALLLWIKPSLYVLKIYTVLQNLVYLILADRIIQKVAGARSYPLLFLSLAWSPLILMGFNWCGTDALLWGMLGILLMDDHPVGAGIAVSLSFLCKQNVGVGAILGLMFYGAFFKKGNMIGYLLGLLALYIVLCPDWGYWIFERASLRLEGGIFSQLYRSIFNPINNVIKLVLGVGVISLISNFRRKDFEALGVAIVCLTVFIFSILGQEGNNYYLHMAVFPILLATLGSKHLVEKTLIFGMTLFPIFTLWKLPQKIIELKYPLSGRLSGLIVSQRDKLITENLLKWESQQNKEKSIFVETPYLFYFATNRVNPTYFSALIPGFEFIESEEVRLKKDLEKVDIVLKPVYLPDWMMTAGIPITGYERIK